MLHTQAQQQTTQNQDEIDLRYYWRLIRQFQWQIIGLAATLTLVAALVVLTMTPIYQSSSRILIEANQAKAVSIQEVVGINTTQRGYFTTQFEILKSREVASKVVDQLDLSNNILFYDPDKPKSFSITDFLGLGEEATEVDMAFIRRRIIDSVMEGIKVSPVKESHIVDVSFQSPSPTLSAEIANAVGEAYIENHLEARLALTKKAATWLRGRLDILQDQLSDSESELQAFKEFENLVDISGIETMAISEVQALLEQLIHVRQEKLSLRNTYDQVKSLEGSSLNDIVSVSAIMSQPHIQQLKMQVSVAASKVAELSKRYGIKHPKMRAAVSELTNANEMLKREVEHMVSGLKKEYTINAELERSLESQIDLAKGRIQKINKKSFALNKLNRDVESNQKIYDMFLTRIKETVDAAGFEAPNARIITYAEPSIYPVKPKKKLIVILAFILGTMLGLGLVILYDMLDNTIKTPADVEEKLHSSMLGILPLIKQEGSDEQSTRIAYKGFIEDKTSGFAEAIRTIRTGVLLSTLDDNKKIFVITSSIPNEGKSTVATNLGAALGQMKKTLIIDADLRRPSLAKTFGHSSTHIGLAECVAGTSTVSDAIIHSEGFDILLAGTIPPNPLELISTERFTQLITDLSAEYDNIIIDSPPTQSVSDALVLSALATGVIYVVKADSTNHTLAQKGIERIQQTGTKVLGVILNQINLSKGKAYDYEYLTGYYDVYGYSSNETLIGEDKTS